MNNKIDAKVNYTVPLSILAGSIGVGAICLIVKMPSDQLERVLHDGFDTLREFAKTKLANKFRFHKLHSETENESVGEQIACDHNLKKDS